MLFNQDITYIPNYFVFEGPDKIGKTTTIKRFAEMLHEMNLCDKDDIIKTRSPGSTEFGQLIRSYTEENYFDKYSQFFSYMIDLTDQKSKIIDPSIQNGLTIVQDRCELSTLIYQSALNGVNEHLTFDCIEKSGLTEHHKIIFVLTMDNDRYSERIAEDVDNHDPIFDLFKHQDKMFINDSYKYLARWISKEFMNYTVFHVNADQSEENLAQDCLEQMLLFASLSDDYFYEEDYHS